MKPFQFSIVVQIEIFLESFVPVSRVISVTRDILEEITFQRLFWNVCGKVQHVRQKLCRESRIEWPD